VQVEQLASNLLGLAGLIREKKNTHFFNLEYAESGSASDLPNIYRYILKLNNITD